MFRKIFGSKTFWIISILVFAFSFVALLNLESVYSTQTDVLLIPQNGLNSSAGEEVLSNLENIMHSASFFKGMLKDDPDIAREEVLELPDNKKKKYWNSKLRTAQIGDSGILRIETVDKSRYDSKVLNTEAVQKFLQISGVFYNLETELEVRIIDRNIITQTTAVSKIVLLLKSLILTLLLALIVFYLFFKFFKGEKSKSSISWLPAKTPVRLFRKDMKKDREISAAIPAEKTAAAPENLPVAEVEKEEIEMKEEKNEKPPVREATPEEVKERLNKLLRGEL